MDRTKTKFEKLERDYFEWLKQRTIAQGAVLDALLIHLTRNAPDPEKAAAEIAAIIDETAGSLGRDRDETLEGHLSYFRSVLRGR
ncbi:MAG: hypothetical protein CML67_02000 [Rhodobacteraceae bacterium]|nr:hypothetical protein [Paracoccaceae bacterium]